ncbi:MAG: hypothetical protein AAGJ54_12520 [Planctomycetota bacterium]
MRPSPDMSPALCVAGLALCVANVAQGQHAVSRAVYRAVATTGEPVPGGLPGEVYEWMRSTPVLSGDGSVLFQARTSTDRDVLILDDGEARLVLATSDTLPATGPRITSIDIGASIVAADGSVTQRVGMEQDGVWGRGLIQIDAAGVITVILRDGDPVPGRADGLVIDGVGTDFAVSDSGDVAAIVGFTDAMDGFGGFGVLIWRDGVATIARGSGDPSPGGTPGHEVSFIRGCSMSPDGTARWLAAALEPGVSGLEWFTESIAPSDAQPSVDLAISGAAPGPGATAQFDDATSSPVTSAGMTAIGVSIDAPDIGPSSSRVSFVRRRRGPSSSPEPGSPRPMTSAALNSSASNRSPWAPMARSRSRATSSTPCMADRAC